MARRSAWALLPAASIPLLVGLAAAALPTVPESPAFFMPELALPSLVPVCPAEPLVLVAADEGPVTKALKLDSDPPGVEVFLKQGTKETKLGTTPLTYEAEFHSKISILRMVFKKKGYQAQTLEVSASQDSVLAKLPSVELAAKPATHDDPALRALQERINPILVKKAQSLLTQESPFDLELAAPLHLTDLDGDISLMITLRLAGAKGLPKGSSKEKQEALLKTLWSYLGQNLVMPLAAALKGEKNISSIVMQVVFNEQRVLFGVEAKMQTKVQTKMEMKCEPGMVTMTRLEFCAMRDYRTSACISAMVTGPVFNPCARVVPVTTTTTTSEVKLDPKTQLTQGQARAQYVVPFSLLNKPTDPEQLYDKIGVLLTDAKGAQLAQHGAMSESLLAVKDPGAARQANGLSERLNKALKSAGFEFKEKEKESLNERSERLRIIALTVGKAGHEDVMVLLLTEIVEQEASSPDRRNFYPWASSALGYYYLKDVVPPEHEKAARMFRVAAEAGEANSQYELARMYINGQGVEVNGEESWVWLRKAAKQGHKEAVAWLERIEKAREKK